MIKLSNKWLRMKSFEDDPIMFAISEGLVQMEAEQEIDRQLTKKELRQVVDAFYEDDEILWHRLVFIREAILKAVGKEGINNGN